MKVDVKKYAIALYQLTQDHKGAELALVLKGFTQMLIKKNLIGQTAKILAAYGDYYNEKNCLLEAEVTSAQKLSSKESKKISEKLEQLTKKNIQLRQKIKPELLGGIVLRINDLMIDGSLQTQLANLKKQMS